MICLAPQCAIQRLLLSSLETVTIRNSDVPSVDFALNDALSMKKYLVTVLGYDENNIIMLNNASQADFNGMFGTKESHKARLFNLVKNGQSDVFVYYSGHGAPDIESNEGYFVPVDCDPTLVRFNGYAIKTLYDNLAKIPYRKLTVVIDACFSGFFRSGHPYAFYFAGAHTHFQQPA